MKLLMNLKKNPLCFFFLVMIFSVGILTAQEQVGGPYTADENTMLLLHFDGDLANESQYSADAVAHGTTYYIANNVPDLGQCLRIDNDSQTDSSYVTVADTSYVDLIGDWTIEGWINIFTFGESSSDWRWVPRLVMKPGAETFWLPNYFLEMWGDTRRYECGYNVQGQYLWPKVVSPDNTLVVGQWLHLAFMRDTGRNILLMATHNANRELVNFNVSSYDPITDNPPTVTTSPVHIGYGGGGGDSWLDGFVDEIRISNVVREFPIPPIVAAVTELTNQTADVTSYDIGANIYTLFSTTVQTATLYYDAGSGFQSVDMVTVSGDSMSAAIPQQVSGTVIKYYIKAVDTDGLSFTQPQNAETDEVYYMFGIYTPNTLTLGLGFEEGSGVPQDASSYEHTVTVVGSPAYSADAAVGSKSIYLEGDSSYLEVDSPFLTAEEFCVDLWLKADSIRDYCRIFNRPSDPNSWSTNNFQIRFNNAQQLQAISDGSVSLTADGTVETGKWYHVIYEVQKAPLGHACAYYAAFDLRDENDVRICLKYEGFDTPVMMGTAPLRIGKAAGGDYPPFFCGYFDDVKIYNHPAAGLLGGTIAPIGGPYTADENTMLLLHFDGDLANESQYSADAVAHGTTYYIANNVPDLGQCLRIDNDSQTDSSYVTVADTSYVDLIGDWTIEGWINIFTFGESSSDWRWVPRLVMKPGAETFWLPNYFLEMWGDTRRYECGYNVQGQYLWPKVVSPDNTLVVGQWLHLAFMRDTGRNILLMATHNANRELVNFNVSSYDPITDNPPTVTTSPVHIGYGGGGGDSWLDGFVDEIRISNVVREFPIPPIVAAVTELTNQTADVTSYDIGANIYTLFSTTVQTATLYYDAGSGFQSVDMVTVSGDSMSAAIPQQVSGTVIKYYVKAVDTDGLSFTQPQNAETDEVYYMFGIYTPNTLTLGLGFEEGSGVPQDASSYEHTVTVVGSPAYSADAAVGSKSIYLEGDSSYLEVDSPFLTAEEFCVDLWLKADSIRDYCRIFNRPSDPNSWSTNNFQIRFNNAQQLQAISDGSVSLTADGTVEIGKWYHVIYEVRKAGAGDTCVYYAAFDLRDENDDRICLKCAGFDTPVMMGTAPLRIGKAAGGDYPPFFCGYFDDVKIYNYPAAELASGLSDEVKLPLKYELSQNYPNPFNPTTHIRFTIPENQTVTLTIYDILGRKVRTLVNNKMTVGKYLKTWNGINDSGSNVASGVYFYRLKTDNYIKVRKMILMR